MCFAWKPPDMIGDLYDFEDESPVRYQVGSGAYWQFNDVPRCSQASDVTVTIQLVGDFSQQIPHFDPPPVEVEIAGHNYEHQIVSGLDTDGACENAQEFRINIPRSVWNDMRQQNGDDIFVNAVWLGSYLGPDGGLIEVPPCPDGNTFQVSIEYVAEDVVQSLVGEMELRSANLTHAGSVRGADPHHVFGKLQWDHHTGGHVCVVEDRSGMVTVGGGCVGVVREDDGSDVAFTAICMTGGFRGSVVSVSTVGPCDWV